MRPIFDHVICHQIGNVDFCTGKPLTSKKSALIAYSTLIELDTLILDNTYPLSS